MKIDELHYGVEMYRNEKIIDTMKKKSVFYDHATNE